MLGSQLLEMAHPWKQVLFAGDQFAGGGHALIVQDTLAAAANLANALHGAESLSEQGSQLQRAGLLLLALKTRVLSTRIRLLALLQYALVC